MNKIYRWFKRLARPLIANLSEIWTLANPFRSRSDDSGFSLKPQTTSRRWYHAAFELPKQIAYDFFSLLFFWRTSTTSREPRKRSRFGWLLILVPFLLVAGTVAFFLLSKTSSLSEKDKASFLAAIEKGDDTAAELIGRSLMSEESKDDPVLKFKYAELLHRLQRTEESDKILYSIAPDNKPGLPMAHVVRAGRILGKDHSQKLAESLESFRWHLSCAGDENQARYIGTGISTIAPSVR